MRKVDPIDVQSVWDIIAHIKWQKTVPEYEKVIKDLIKSRGSTLSEWKKCLDDMVCDNLLEKAWKRSDSKVQALTFPTSDKLVSDKTDWYCFQCHKAGNVKLCCKNSCHRVFHADCSPKDFRNIFFLFLKLITNSGSTISLKNGRNDIFKALNTYSPEWDHQKKNYDCNACIICNMKGVDTFCIEKLELNTLLKFVHMRSRAWVPKDITHKMNGAEPYPDWITENDLASRAKLLIFFPMDMTMIEEKIEHAEYSKFTEYLADIFTIKHNIGIFHNPESQEYEATKFVSRDVFHDIGEIVSCIDCFKHSSEMLSTDWFALPCRNSHEVVWAKQKGYCYWPAKVIKKFGSTFDVRFFGTRHERAIVNQECIKPITIPRHMLQLKTSGGLEKAINEMELLMKFIENPLELETYISTNSKSSKKSNSPRKPNSNESDKPLKKRKNIVKVSTPSTRSSLNSSSSSLISVKEENDVKKTEDDYKKEVVVQNFKKPSSVPVDADAVSVMPSRKRKQSDNCGKCLPIMNDEPIKISDEEDNVYTFSGSLTKSAMEFNDSFEEQEVELVTSSTEGEDMEDTKQNKDIPQLIHSYNDEVEKMKNNIQGMSSKEAIIRAAMNFMQTEINRLTEKHNEQLKIIAETHKKEISATKKKQWCYFCEQDAIYHCCWNTAYCSVQCQKQHWQQDHKKVCRRKR